MGGHGGGCAKDGSTINEPTPPPVARTFVRVMTAFGGDWLAPRWAAAAMVVSIEVVVDRVGNSSGERGRSFVT